MDILIFLKQVMHFLIKTVFILNKKAINITPLRTDVLDIHRKDVRQVMCHIIFETSSYL